MTDIDNSRIVEYGICVSNHCIGDSCKSDSLASDSHERASRILA